jgi:hypothetical protein
MPTLTPVVSGNTIYASDLNNLLDILSRQSGQSETGIYFIAGPAYTNGSVVAEYYGTLSRGTTPSSVTIDTAIQAATGGMSGTPSTGQVSGNGFQVYSLSTTTGVNNRAGGNTTVAF